MGPDISVVKPGTVVLDYGPITMSISVQGKNGPMTRVAQKGAQKAVETFERFAPIRRSAYEHTLALTGNKPPQVLLRMAGAVKASGDTSLTMMAAVAGSFADVVADKMIASGATKVIVNNGGDIAVRLKPPETVVVGIAEDITHKTTRYALKINSSSGIGGVCTSGLGGRSMTLGVASAVTVAAETAAIADACATSLANAVNVDSTAVVRRLAEEINPDTDIKGRLVTVEVGVLSQAEKGLAVLNGLTRAQDLYQAGVIRGAVICLQGRVETYPKDFVRLLPSGGQPPN